MTIHHTRPEQAEVHESGWAELPRLGVEVTRLPLIDLAHSPPAGTQLFARLNYKEAMAVAAAHGARLISHESIQELRRVGLQLMPFLGTPKAENGIEHSERHDANVWRQLRDRLWDGLQPVSGAGKHWIAGAKPGWSRLEGWDVDGPGPGSKEWQSPADAHQGGEHFDDGTTTMLERDVDASERITRDEIPPPPSMPPPPAPTNTDGGDATGDGGDLLGKAVGTIREGARRLAELVSDAVVAAASEASDAPHALQSGDPVPPGPLGSDALVPGIDVSSNQRLDLFAWPIIASEFRWLMARASYGARADSICLNVVKRARASGLQVGLYAFFRQQQPREQQLATMLEQLVAAGTRPGDIVPVVDLEDNPKWDGALDVRSHNENGRWLVEELARRFGGAMIYTAPYHWQNLGRPEWMDHYPIWIADYGKGRTEPRWPVGTWSIWQRMPRAIAGYAGGKAPHVIDTNVARRLPLIP